MTSPCQSTAHKALAMNPWGRDQWAGHGRATTAAGGTTSTTAMGGNPPPTATRLDPDHWSYSTDPAFEQGRRIAYHWKGELTPVAPSKPSPQAEEHTEPSPSPSPESYPKPERPPPKPSTQEPRVTNPALERKASAIVLHECARLQRPDGSLIRLPRTQKQGRSHRTPSFIYFDDWDLACCGEPCTTQNCPWQSACGSALRQGEWQHGGSTHYCSRCKACLDDGRPPSLPSEP